MNILEKIIAHKYTELAHSKEKKSVRELEASENFQKPVYSLKKRLTEQAGIIAEFKRKSPSKGFIHEHAQATLITEGYQQAGARGISVLTDENFFAGHPQDLQKARKKVHIPILRKDFIIDEYQILEAKSWGADVILLIAACLSPTSAKELAHFARSLGLEVLLEVHSQAELESHLHPTLDLIGVNNRNLHNFEVSITTSLELVELIPSEFIRVTESGLQDPGILLELFKVGYQGFLIGESFMRAPDPARMLQEWVEELNTLQ